MSDTLKWVLITLLSAVAVFAGGEALGVDWILVQVSILAFLETVGLLMLLFTGSAAAMEIAKYYRRKNKHLEQEQDSGGGRRLTGQEMNALVERAVQNALAQARPEAEAASPAPVHDLLADLDLEGAEEERVRERRPRGRV